MTRNRLGSTRQWWAVVEWKKRHVRHLGSMVLLAIAIGIWHRNRVLTMSLATATTEPKARQPSVASTPQTRSAVRVPPLASSASSNRVDSPKKSQSSNRVESNQKPNSSSSDWVALCAALKDEERYIDEWADYHLALGFDLFLYDTHPNFTLAPWFHQRKRDFVHPHQTNATRVHMTHYRHAPIPKGALIQTVIYDACLRQLRALPHPPKWVAMWDGDEFLVVRDMDRYPNAVSFFNDYLVEGALQINWVVMGSANETVYRDEPITHRFRYAVGASHHNTKTVAVLDHVDRWRIHYAMLQPGGYTSKGMNGKVVPANSSSIRGGDVSVAAIFHYKYKSADEYNTKQCWRGSLNKAVRACPPVVEVGTVWDDAAWRALTRLLPSYRTLVTGTR